MAVNFQNVNLLLSAGDSRQFPKNGLPQIALSGRSNVGKSTLVNMLLGRNSLARVSGEPGKTVTINFYNVDGKFLLADLPGYGYARRPAAELEKLRTLTDAYFTANPGLDRLKLVLQLIDLKTGPSDDDWLMLDFLRQKGLPFAVIGTKADKLNKTDLAERVTAFSSDEILSSAPFIPSSDKTKAGCAEIRSLILLAAGIH